MTLRSRKAKFPGLETQKTDLFDPYSHHYVSRTLGNEYQLINTLPEAKHCGRGIRLWGYSSVTWTGRLVRIKCACSKIYVNLKWIPVSQYSGFKNSKKVILHQHNLKNTAVETQERISANSWMLTQLNTTVSEYLNQNRASLKRPAYPCTLTRSIQTGCVTCTSENPFSSICPAILPASSPTPALHFLSAPKLLCHWNKHSTPTLSSASPR